MKKSLLVVKIERSKRDEFHKAARSLNKYGSQILMETVNRTIQEYEEKGKVKTGKKLSEILRTIK